MIVSRKTLPLRNRIGEPEATKDKETHSGAWWRLNTRYRNTTADVPHHHVDVLESASMAQGRHVADTVVVPLSFFRVSAPLRAVLHLAWLQLNSILPVASSLHTL